ncbi:MAG: hypothetical protein M3094_07295, partial [Actinomycetia bacterium]|nr:hypothetical protein [Actinomycetes bacterium]
MTSFIVADGIGSISSGVIGDAPDDADALIDSTSRIEADNVISLTSPTQLNFANITWKFRAMHTFAERAPFDANLREQQQDVFIDGWTGYSRDGSWYTFGNADNEWLEIHGAVDGAWWQLLFQGLGKALFTDGDWSQEVTIVAGEWYYVSMSVSTLTTVGSLTLTDRHGVIIASTMLSDISVALAKS